MRIGIEGRTLQGQRYGVARVLVNLLRHLVEIDEQNAYTVYLSRPIETLGFTSPNLELKVLGKVPSILWRHFRLPLAMRRDRVDLHFSPSYFLPLVKVCPSVVAVFDLTFKVHPEWFVMDRRLLFDDIFWREVKRAEAIITTSEHSKGDIVRVLGVDPDKVKVIPAAADVSFRPVRDETRLRQVREKYDLSAGFLFTAGAIHTRRNLIRLIEAVSEASRALDSDLQLLILGTPAPFSPPIDIQGAARRCGLEGKVIHIDYVCDEDLLLLYNACEFFVYPSLYEGFGLPVIEAMACGTPVACSSTTSLPEVAGEAAVYFDPMDVEEMAAAIVRLMSDSLLREELRDAGIKRASSFTWRRFAEEVHRVFQQVLGEVE